MVLIRRSLVYLFLSVLTFCFETCLVVMRSVLAAFDAPVQATIDLVCAIARSFSMAYEPERTRPSMQLAGFGHVAMLKGLGA